MSFPLQKLPYLAFKEVLSTMEIREKFLIATSSKKSARLVKNCVSSEKYKLSIMYCERWDLEKEEEGDKYSSSECEGVFETLHDEIEFIVDVFNKPIIWMYTDDPLDSYTDFIPTLEVLQLKVFTLRFECGAPELQNLLEKCKENPQIEVSIDSPSIGVINRESRYHFDSIHLIFIDKIDWDWYLQLILTLLDCKFVTIETMHQHGGASQELQEKTRQWLIDFLNQWISGSRLEYLEIGEIPLDHTNFRTVFEALGQVVPVKQAKSPKKNGDWDIGDFDADTCFMITQKDSGRKAVVYVVYSEIWNITSFVLRVPPANSSFEFA
uniref:F-box domain-containing protein n=1 Tax=Caenorhabditis tropicalis TaxID=1561998 RepID=A0A1I7USY7_9PELO